MIQRLRFYAAGLLLAVTLTALSAGCAKNASEAASTPPTADQMQAQKQAGEVAAAAAKAQGEAAARAAAARQAGTPH